jgi:hypothetical protein
MNHHKDYNPMDDLKPLTNVKVLLVAIDSMTQPAGKVPAFSKLSVNRVLDTIVATGGV